MSSSSLQHIITKTNVCWEKDTFLNRKKYISRNSEEDDVLLKL